MMNETGNLAMVSKDVYKIGFVNIFAILQLTSIRTYFVIFLEEDLLTEIFIISLLLTIQNLIQIFFRIPLSNFSQIIGRKPLIILGTSCYTLGLLFLAIADSWVFALITVIFVAVGMSAYWPAVFSLLGDVSDTSKENNVGEMNGRVFQFGDIGQLLAAGLASYFLAPNTLVGSISIAELYSLLFVIGAIGNVVSYFILKESLTDDNKLVVKNKWRELWRSVVGVFSNFVKTSKLPGLLPIYVLQFFIAFIEFGFVSYFPSLLKEYEYLESDIADLILWTTLLLILLKPRLGKVNDLYGYRKPVIIGFFTTAIAIILITIVNNFIIHLLAIALIIAVMTIHYTSMNASTSSTAPNDKRGIALGTLGVYTSLGRGLSTLIIGILASYFQIVFALQIFGVIIFIGGFIFYKL